MKNQAIEQAWASITQRCKRVEPSRSLHGRGAAKKPAEHYFAETDVRKTWKRFKPKPVKVPANVQPIKKRAKA